MPTLTPSCPPPLVPTSPSSSCASSNIMCPSVASSQVSTPPTSPEEDAVTQRLHVPSNRESALKIPCVRLEIPAIKEDMAASLAVALLGHVLFLKSQVPFPVAQLGRIPGASSAPSRAARKRADMITAFDELSSHLHTTFSALSTALARNPAHRSTATVHLAFVLGPTVGAPKARVVLALEGLEVKIWGMREDAKENRSSPSCAPREDDDEEEEEQEEDYASDDGSEAGDDDPAHADAEQDGDGTSDVGDTEDSPPASEPPLSRSPSPSLPPAEEPSQPSSPAPANPIRRPLRQLLSPGSSPSSSASSRPYLAPKPAHTRGEEQQALRAAERLLARTLANAYAEGGGIAAELAPTQTHVLLRAPRRFSHPAWLPRQNVSASLDNVLRDFLVGSGIEDPVSTGEGRKAPRRGAAGIKTKTEGVLVTCRASPDDSMSHPPARLFTSTTVMEASESEEGELIWWAWDGKLTGFAEW